MTTPPASQRPELSVVVGVQHAQANIPAVLAALGSASSEVEILLCHAADDPLSAELVTCADLQIIQGRADALIPELWRDGILQARADKVALLSAHCIPDADWLRVALSLDMALNVAYGGAIDCASGAGAVGRAIHLLRYSAFTALTQARQTSELAADNAIYDRAAILACDDLLPLGFWEPSYHARFRARGLSLALTPELRVVHTNRYTARAFMRQRRLHGRAFGRARAEAAPRPRRWLMMIAAPAAFPVYAAKLTLRILRRPVLRRGFVRAAPWFYLFAVHWSLGEALGYVDGAFGRAAPERAGARQRAG